MISSLYFFPPVINFKWFITDHEQKSQTIILIYFTKISSANTSVTLNSFSFFWREIYKFTGKINILIKDDSNGYDDKKHRLEWVNS